MPLFDESKVCEKAIGEEATRTLAEILERYDESSRKEMATRVDLAETELRIKAELTAELHKAKAETIKRAVGLLIAQTAALVALIKVL